MSCRAAVLSSALMFLSVVGCGESGSEEPEDGLDSGTPDSGGATGSQRPDAATGGDPLRDSGRDDALDASAAPDAAQRDDGGLVADASGPDAAVADASVLDATVSTDATVPTADASVELVELSATLTSFITDAPLTVVQEVSFLNNQTGAPLTPPVQVSSSATTGKFTAKVPPGAHIVWVKGAGDALTGNFDTVLLNVSETNWTDTIGVFPNSTAMLADLSGQYIARSDRAALTGAVYWTQNGERVGTVGCAKVYIDGKTAPDVDQSQLYNFAANGLPVPLLVQDQTAKSGLFSFGNITKGTHTIRASIDDGQTFLGDAVTFYVPFTSAEASSELKRVLAQLAIDIEASANPTPADCN